MKNGCMKRLLSMLLVMFMVFSLLPTSAFAAEETESHAHCETCGQHDCICCDVCGQAECVCPEETDAPTEETEAPAEAEQIAVKIVVDRSDWTDEMLAIQEMIDTDIIEYYLGYYGFEMPTADLTALQWAAVQAEIENIVVNVMPAGELENALSSIREVEYMMTELLTEEQAQTVIEANPVFVEFAQLTYTYGVEISELATSDNNFANGTINITSSGSDSADKASGVSDTGVTYGCSGKTFQTGSTNTITVKNISGLRGTISFSYSMTDVNSYTGFTSSSGTYSSGEIDHNATVTLSITGKTGYNPLSSTPDGSVALSNITFTPATRTVTFGTVAQGGSYTVDGATPPTASVTANYGTQYTLVATVDTENDYTFAGWFVSGKDAAVSTELTYTHTLTENVTITPRFALPEVTVEFVAADEGGTYTVNGNEPSTLTEAVGSQYTLAAVPDDGYALYGWYDVTNGEFLSFVDNYTLTSSGNMTVKPVFVDTATTAQFAVGDQTFYSLNLADAAATAAGGATIVLLNNGTLHDLEDYTISSGNTLLIPMDAAGTVYTTTPATHNKEKVSYVQPTAYRTLTMAQGANITVNGAISIAGSQHAGGTGDIMGGVHGPVGFIKMATGSKITVNSGANLYAWGYIIGSGEVEVLSSGTVYESFQTTDWRGGSATSAVVEDNTYKVFPMSQYYVQNVEVPMKLNAGAVEKGYSCTTVSYVGVEGAEIPFVGENSMFTIDSGYLIKDYDETTDRQTYKVYGNVSMEKIRISMQVTAINNVTMDSSEYVLPITNNLTVDVVSGTIEITQDLAFLPGSEIIIREGAVCNLADGKSVYVYDLDEWGGYCGHTNRTFAPLPYAPGRTYTRTSLSDAKIQIDGTVNADAGFLYTTSSGAIVVSTGTGKVNMCKGSATCTYQFNQVDTTCNEVEIPITVAKLQNADGTTTNPDKINPEIGVVYTYIDGVWVADCPGEGTCVLEGEFACQPQACKYCDYTESVASADHTPGDAATCTTAQTCTVCGDVLAAALGHSEETIPAVAATCYSTGLTAGVKCNREGCGEILTEQTVTEKIDHTWSKAVQTKAPTCTEDGENTYTCTVTGCGATKTETVEATGHQNVDAIAQVDATCTTDGHYAYWYCKDCQTYFATMTTEGEIVTYSGAFTDLDAWKSGTGKIAATGHTITEHAEVPSTCTSYGTKAYYSCSVCGKSYTTKTVEGETVSYSGEIDDLTTWLDTVGLGKIAMAAHNDDISVAAVAATCQAPGSTAGTKCSVCQQVQSGCTEIAQLSHVGTLVTGQAATCTADGWNDYYKCNNGCQGYFTTKGEDNILTGEITDLETWKTGDGKIAALGHHLVYVGEVPKTCTTAGTAAHYKCDRENCGLLFKSEEDAQNNTSVSKDALIIEAGHTPADAVIENKDETTDIYELVVYCSVETCKAEISRTTVTPGTSVSHTNLVQLARVEPTCTKTGLTAGAYCATGLEGGCPACAQAKETYKVEQEEIPALGHSVTLSAVTFTWSTDYSTCTATATCTVDGCGATVTETVNATETARTNATCEAAGSVTYTSAAFTNEAFTKAGITAQTKTVTLTQLTHNWGEVEYVWSDDYSTCTATQKCSHNSADSCVRTAKIENIVGVTTSPTCIAAGYTTYNADFTQNWATGQTQKKAGDSALGHLYVVKAGTAVWNTVDDKMTCTATLTCNRTDCTVEIENVTATVTVSAQTDATCEADGAITYAATFAVPEGYTGKMSELQKALNKEVAVAQLGHDYEYTYEWSNDYSTCTATRICKHDSTHTNTETVNAVSSGGATCTAAGTIIYTATFTGDGFTVQIKEVAVDALGHSVEAVAQVAPTCQQAGVAAHYKCTRCSALFLTEEDAQNNKSADLETAYDNGGLKMPIVGHSYTNYTEKSPATCTANKTEIAYCDYNCEMSNTREVENTKLDHVYTNYVYNNDASCLKAGTETAECDTCDTNATDTRNSADHPQLAHAYTNEEVIEAATCTTTGTSRFYCTNGCNNYEARTTAAKGHTMKAEAISGKAATCAEPGYKACYQCAVCGYYFANETDTAYNATPIATTEDKLNQWQTEGAGKLDKIAHEYESVVTAPTCLQQGYTTYTCKNCAEGTDGHSYVDTYVDATKHAYDSGVITTQPTCTATGIKTYTCQNSWCDTTGGYTYTESVEATGHTLEKVTGQAATCIAAGWNDYYQCTVCKYYFANAADTAANADPIAKTAEELTAWQKNAGAIAQLDHVDANNDHKCDYAACGGKVISSCVDSNSDHLCDYEGCKATMSSCVDESPKDHYCDYEGCKQQLSTCADADTDTDHLCDYCQKTIGDHEYTNGVCNCGYVEDVTVNITIKAENADDKVLTEENIKYKNNGEDFTKTLDLSDYGTCFTIQSVTVKVGNMEVESSYDGNTLTVASELLTDDVVITVNAYQYHVVGTINTTSTPASCGVAGSIVTTITCKNCGTMYSTTTQEIPALEHEYSGVYTEPTFDADGYTTYTCKNGCGGSYVVTDDGTKLIAVARIGSTRYQTLEEAIAAAGNRDTIELLTKVTVDGTQVWDKNITVLIPYIDNSYGLIIKGDLTIKKGTFVVNGFFGIGVQTTGKLTINGGAFELEDGVNNDYLIGSWGTTVINGGTFKGQYSCVNGFEGSLIINGGTFTTDEYDYTGGYESSDVFAEEGVAQIMGGTFSKTVEGYLATGYCQKESNGVYVVAAHTHQGAVQENVVPANCTDDGSYDWVVYCSRCDAELSREENIIPATGHTVEVIDGLAATCTTAGYEEAYYCSVCKKYFATKISDTELADEIEGELSTWQTEGAGKINALGHALTKVDEVSATCEGAGVKEYWQCSRCSAAFEDEAETTAIADLATWKAEGGNGYIVKLGHNYTSEVTTAPTCEKEGVRTYTCQNDNSHTYTESIDALGHKYKVEYTWNDDLTVCTASATCENPGCYNGATKTATVTKTVVTAATCEENGNGYMTASFTEADMETYGFETQTKNFTIDATGHSFTKYTADGNATCTEDGTKTAYCDNGCGETKTVANTGAALSHNMKEIAAKDATCTEAGNIHHYYCQRCLLRFTDEAGKEPIETGKHIIAALQHDYKTEVTAPTCEAKGYTTYTCSRGDHTYVADYVDALGHAWNDGVITTEPTCTKTGVKTFTCERGCSKEETVAATGHNGKVCAGATATCTETGYKQYYQCQNSCDLFYEDQECTKLIGDADALATWKAENGVGHLAALGHNLTDDAGKTPDCTNAGYSASYHCARCQKHFSDKENETLIGDGSNEAYAAWKAEGGDGYIKPNGHTDGEVKTENVVAPQCEVDGSHDEVTYCTVCEDETSRVTKVDEKTGHTQERTVAAMAPTCLATGLTEGKYCDACDTWTVPQTVVAATGHTKVTDAAVVPTCTTTGLTEGAHCSECDAVLVAQTVVPMLSHSYTEIVSTTLATCTEDGNQVLKCKNCNDTITQTLEAPGHNSNGVLAAVEPTCTTTGLTAGKECTVCGYDTEPQKVVPAQGHTITETAEVAAKCDEYGTKAYYYCETCEKYFATKVSETELADEITDLATWLDTVGQGKIEKLAHTNEVIPAVNPTCTEDGLKAGVKCAVCGTTLVEQEVDPAKGHNSVTDKEVAPTCTTTGLTEGAHCSVCQDILVKQEVIAAKGHSATTVSAVAATCTTDGVKEYYTCATCGKHYATKVSETELADEITNLTAWKSGDGKIAKLGHKEEILVKADPTCTTTGLTEGKYCPVCDTTTVAQDVIPATGHKETILSKVYPTCTETGLTEGKQCSVCNEILTAQETVSALGHNPTSIAGQKAKCEQAGWKDCYQCSTCKKYFEDEQCEQPIEDLAAWRTGDGMIAGLEHVWDEGRITTLPTCTENGVKTYTCSTCNGTKTAVEPMLGHDTVQHAGQHPTYYSAGWDAYETCTRCDHTTMTGIPALGEPSVHTYEEFMASLKLLEEYANAYVKANPGKDPMLLLIKYVRTGVDRYNSGSWQIMAGYEDEAFAEYVKTQEEAYNKSVPTIDDMINVTGIKNIAGFELPNGQTVDFGHMFGTMDITYHNKTSINHADVSGWAGDLVDLLDTADRHGVSGTVDEMIAEIGENYLNHSIEGESDQFSQTDMYGDLDGYYFMKEIIGNDYEAGMLYNLMEAYFTEDLTDEQRADYFLKNRLGGVTGRNEIREAVFNEYLGNSMIATLEDTRNFVNEDVSDLRKASCYAFADYLCYLAGDYVELGDNPYFSVFSTELSTLAPGITQQINKATTADGKQVVYYTATADVTSPYVHVYANYKDNDPSLGWGMQRVLDQANAAQAKYGDPDSEQYIENYNVIAAINGAGYNMTTGEPAGVLMMNGIEYHAPDGNGFVGILKDGTATMGTTAQYYELKEKGLLSEAIAIFGTKLIEDGKINITANSNYYNDRASRTAFGITKTGKVVFMVMDGRQEPVSCGGSMIEIAQVMLEAGCIFAVNLDGGGSTTYVARQEGDSELSLVSSPSDGFQRSVSTSWMMVSTAPSSTAFDHAVLDSDVRHLTIGATTQVTASGVSATGNSVELPEGVTWAVSDASVVSINEDGLVTALANGTVDVYLMLDDEIVGTRTLNVVIPDAVYFTKENMNAVYGEPKELPVAALFEGKPVAIVESDVYFSLSNESAGTTEGFNFIGNEESGIKTVKIYVHAVNNPDATSGSMGINLFRADEASFDFENADGGDRLLAWNRVVSNATTADNSTYTVVDKTLPMVTEYTFAMDMTQIPMPDKLTDLVYMLPGADVEGNNSAWDFLLQLAERVSVLTEVKAVLKLDPNFDVDYSELTVNCEYFVLEKTEFNEETNELTLSLRWKDQTKAIDPDTANPLVILTGFKLTPKTDAAWDAKERLTVINTGEIGYDIYLRANALYSFSSKPENQEAYGLYPFVNEDVIVGGSPESGGHFADTYKTFSDEYTLNKGMKNGWVYEDGGYAYYEDDVKYTGIRKAGQFYYDFGENGINMGQTKYTGMFQIDGINYYSKEGVLSGGWYIDDDDKYYFDETGKAVDGEFVIDEVKMVFENGLLIGGHTGFLTKTNGYTYYYQNGSMTYGWMQLGDYWYHFNVENGIMTVGDGTADTKLLPDQEAEAKGAYYVFDAEGHALYGFPNKFGYYYWAGQPARSQWVLNGYDLDGWYHTNDNGHYVTTPDASQLFELTLDGKTYTAVKIAYDGVVYTFDNSNGKLLLGSMVLKEGKWYYYWAGEPVNDGWFDFNGETYYAFEDGHLATGAQNIDGESYMFTPQGALIKEGTTLSVTMSDDFTQMTVKTSQIKDVTRVMMGVWSEASNQTDMQWFEADVDANGIWSVTVRMCLYENTGIYQIHAYEFDENGTPVKLLVDTSYEVTKAGHIAAEAVKENEVEATCTKDGSYENVVYCSVCKGELSRETVTVEATGHTYGEATRANVTEPTCTINGSYDKVIRCTVCNEILETQHIVLPATGHVDADEDGKCDVCGEDLDGEENVIWTIAMLRLYNPNTGEHFYTGSEEERDMLMEAGWNYEGIAWHAPVNAGAPIHRLFNPNSGDHHYTGSEVERDNLVALGWQYEGVAWNTMGQTNCPQYRLYNPNADIGSHHYTGSIEERDYLVSLGWHYEGIAWYGCDEINPVEQ